MLYDREVNQALAALSTAYDKQSRIYSSNIFRVLENLNSSKLILKLSLEIYRLTLLHITRVNKWQRRSSTVTML